MNLTGTIRNINGAVISSVNIDVDTSGMFLTRRDNLALCASEPSQHEIDMHGHKEVEKAKADDSYIKQAFDYEAFRYGWADLMIAASGEE